MILINPFSGISSYGGIIGGSAGFFLFAHLTKIRVLQFADTANIGFLVLLTFGRAGCASVHDHIGVASDFALAVDFPPQNPHGVVGPHHDLGLYEFLYLVCLLGATMLLFRRPRRPGWILGLISISYSVPRFFIEFLRRNASDPRYFELTPVQWSALATFFAGAILMMWLARQKSSVSTKYKSVAPWRDYVFSTGMNKN